MADHWFNLMLLMMMMMEGEKLEEEEMKRGRLHCHNNILLCFAHQNAESVDF